MYFFKKITPDIHLAQLKSDTYSPAMMLVLGALLAGIATILQSAGGIFPGVGYFISPLATAPILFCFILSFWTGMISYVLTSLLLLIFQPSELIVFPFTTGLLGVGLGIAFSRLNKRLNIIGIGAAFLTLGIITLLYVFRFPVLGPVVSTAFSFLTISGIYLFAFLYAWMWVEFVLFFFKKIKNIIP
ncbi:hypothetical protein [Bacillus sp. FJAT-27445]|uniref:hypothetical protein n=1 Tax=Bacillus sp. FJAT-27445 TaxID=1679166 RepID=UPI0007438030|nr:hypothetical protein [Bacillus sp. FJAT-27445]